MKIKWLNKNLVGFSLASLFSDANHEIVPLVLPGLLEALVGSARAPQFVGFISGFATMVQSVAVLISGWLSDRLVNRRPLILLGYLLMACFVGFLGFAQNWLTVFLLVTFTWIGRGLCSAPRNAIIADSIEPQYFGHAFGFRQLFDTLGAILGPFLVYLLLGSPTPLIYYLSFVLGGLSVLMILLFVKDVPHRLHPKKSILDFTGFTRSFYWLLTVFIFFGLGNFNRTLLLLRIQNTLQIKQSTLVALSLVTLLYIFRNIVQAISAYWMGALSDRIGRKIPLGVCGFGFFGLMALFLIYPLNSIYYLLTVFFLSGFAAGTYMTLQKTMAADFLPEDARGMGYGVLQLTTSTADLVSSLIVGFLWSFFSPEIGFMFAAIMSFLACALLLKKL